MRSRTFRGAAFLFLRIGRFVGLRRYRWGMTETVSRTAALANGLLALHRKSKITILPTATGGAEDAASNLLAALDAQGIELVPVDASDDADCTCIPATLETAFRPHEALVGVLEQLDNLGVLTLESDIDVVAARMIAALDDVGACVAYEEDAEPDERPRNTEDRPEPAPEVCPFLIPFIKSEHWAAGDTHELGGVQFTVVRGGK